MKVEVKDAGFQPVVITIETAEELDAVNDALRFYLDKEQPDGAVMTGLELVRELFVEMP